MARSRRALGLAHCHVPRCTSSATDLSTRGLQKHEGEGSTAVHKTSASPACPFEPTHPHVYCCTCSATDLSSRGLQKHKGEHCRAQDFCLNCMPGDDQEGGQGETKCWAVREPILYKMWAFGASSVGLSCMWDTILRMKSVGNGMRKWELTD
eukprot:1151557-Pelagomonas_calceolata.AAC.1